MINFLNKIMLRNKKKKSRFEEMQGYKADMSIYESTYETPLTVLMLSGLRLTHQDSSMASMLWSILYWFGIFNMIIASILELLYMVQVGRGGTFDDVVEIISMMPCVGYLIMAVIKSYKIFMYRPVFENLVSELRSMWPQESITKEEYDIITKPINRLNFINKGYFWCNHLLLALFITPHVVDVVRSWMGYQVVLKLPFFFWLPFDPNQKYVYEFMLVLQSWEGLVTVWLILSCDLLFCVFMSHITTQFDLLGIRIQKLVYVPTDKQLLADYPLAKNNMNYLYKNREILEMYGPADWESKYIKEINQIILRHRALIRLSGDVESVFSFELLVNFINSSIIICFCGFCCVVVEKWNEFIYKTFLTTALLQTWLFCWYGQRLLEASVGVGDALYNSGWYLLPKSVRSKVLIILHRAQKRVCVTTYGFSVISLTSYTTIIKTSWSYLTLLLNTYKK